TGKGAAVAPASAEADGDVEPPANADLITTLIGLELYDLARNEVLYAQRTEGDSPLLSATLAWTYYKENDLRRGILYMKRAYPQFLSAHGAALPDELLRVIYPMDYWPLISRYSKQRGLDPFLVAALINQESSFLPDARSSANAIGLMQIVPSTGRRIARQQRIRFTRASLTRPDYNIRLGTAYFADLIERLGGVHLALASYNAGAHRVAVWRSERPGLERDEFIDDIPFPETQTYVKKILGSAEDYRALYQDLSPGRKPAVKAPAKKSTVKVPAKKGK
ncbi:MAG: slt 1, partial [Acidobacteria bacterium]|nr:slt 1 [Acidobacteriota bacterium]